MAAAGLIRVAVGFWHLRQLRKTCVRIDSASLDPLLRKTLQEFDSPRSVAVCVSDSLRVPTAIGFVSPLVVIPAWAMQELSPTELNTILLHELAHLRRWDDWTNLVQKVLGALLFFHPAVWWIEKKLALEREMACDDLVLARTESPRAYAECLVSLAEKSLLRRGLALAQAAVGRMRHMSLRVAQILDEKRPGATRVWRPAPALLAGISLAVVMIFSGAPRLVSFDNGSADRTARGHAMAGRQRWLPTSARHEFDVVTAECVAEIEDRAGQICAEAEAKICHVPAAPNMVDGAGEDETGQVGHRPGQGDTATGEPADAGPQQHVGAGCDCASDPDSHHAYRAIRCRWCAGLGSVRVAGDGDGSGTRSNGAGNCCEVDMSFFLVIN